MNTTPTAYTQLATTEQIERTMSAVQARSIKVQLAANSADALERVQQLLPDGAEVMTAASQTLKEIGLEEQLKAKSHAWTNLKDAMLAEHDLVKQGALRIQSTVAAYYLGSVHAIAETGEIVIASHSGSQIPSYAFSSKNVIWVAGVQKIVPTLEDGIRRVREYSLPLEDAKMKAMGMRGSIIGKLLIFEREVPHLQRNVHLILVNQLLGV